jgi:hypothetical protein
MRLTHKFLDVGNHHIISDEVYNYVINRTEVLTAKPFQYYTDLPINHVLQHCPALVEFLNSRHLVPARLAVIVVDSRDTVDLHIDNDGSSPYVRILWPIKNCEGSETRFFSVPEGAGRLEADPNGTIVTGFERNQPCEQIDAFELTSPVLLDVSVPHSVHPNTERKGWRISFTIGFDRDLPISKSIKAWFGFQR